LFERALEKGGVLRTNVPFEWNKSGKRTTLLTNKPSRAVLANTESFLLFLN
jgi:hypothetical protein